MFESYAKPAATKADPEPVPGPGVLSALIQAGGGATTNPATEALRAAVMPTPAFGQGILGFAEQHLVEEQRRRREQAAAAAAGLVAGSPWMRFPGRPSPMPAPGLPGPATQPAPGMAGYNPAWNGLAPGAPQTAQYFAPTDPAYGYQDQMAMRNSAGV